MNTTPTATAHETVSNESIFHPEPPNREQTRRYVRLSVVGDMLESALQDVFSSLHLTLIQIVDTEILEFDEFLHGRADALLKIAMTIEDRFSQINHLSGNGAMRRYDNISFDVEASIYMRFAHEKKWPPSYLHALESTIVDAFELYAQVELFMWAVGCGAEDGPGYARERAPRITTMTGPHKNSA